MNNLIIDSFFEKRICSWGHWEGKSVGKVAWLSWLPIDGEHMGEVNQCRKIGQLLFRQMSRQ